MVLVVQGRMESTVVVPDSRVVERDRKSTRLPAVAVGARNDHVDVLRIRRVDRVVADDRMVVGIVVDPVNGVALANLDRERGESVLGGYANQCVVTLRL